ncbi:MAG: M48 family metalloprotease [Treponema sp.]|jgi:predicted Zn-dependent protease|nr:M48 family metalloprotease [Treponema sp.]
MKTKTVFKVLLLVMAVVFTGFAYSCKGMSVAAQIAGAAGLIDQNTANAISQSAEAISKANEDMTPEQEYYIGRAVGANILASYKVWNGNPAQTAYINKVCGAIIVNSPRPDIYNGYHVNILDSTEINAFATSGGHIFVTRGLIDNADSEDTLAAVIAHEISHIQLQHGLKAIKNSRFQQAILVTATSAAGAATGTDVKELTSVFNESIGEILTTMVNNGYSQTQEFEADSFALSLLASAGYNPGGLVTMLKALEKSQGNHPGGFNKTHPTPAKRVENAEQLLPKYNVRDTGSFRSARYAAAVK